MVVVGQRAKSRVENLQLYCVVMVNCKQLIAKCSFILFILY